MIMTSRTTSNLPAWYGFKVIPSGILPFSLNMLTGFFVVDIPAAVRIWRRYIVNLLTLNGPFRGFLCRIFDMFRIQVRCPATISLRTTPLQSIALRSLSVQSNGTGAMIAAAAVETANSFNWSTTHVMWLLITGRIFNLDSTAVGSQSIKHGTGWRNIIRSITSTDRLL